MQLCTLILLELNILRKNAAVYFDSFGIEYIEQEVFNEIKEKAITRNIVRLQDDYYNMYGFYCITLGNI